jgi:TonB family protein
LTAHALLDKGRAQIETKEYASATEAITRASEMGDDEIRDDVAYFRGLVHERQGNLPEAKAAYAIVLDRHEDSEWLADAGMALGKIRKEEGDLEGAVASYERVRKKARRPEERFNGGLEKGKALLEAGQYERARTTFSDLSKRTVNEKQRGQALNFMGQAQQKSGNAEAAFATYRDILSKMPRTEAAADAQLAIAKTFDDGGDYIRAKEEYEKVNEQGTGFESWRTASTRITEIQKVLDLRESIDNEQEKEEDRLKKRFLLAEQLLEKIGDVPSALAQYSALADQAVGTELGARSLFAEAWIYENRMSRPDTAEVLFYELASRYRGTDADAAARRRLGLPVWKFQKVELPNPTYAVNEAETKGQDIVVKRVEPRAATLPEGKTEATVWVRVTVGENGEVTGTKVSKSAGEDVDAAAVEAAKATIFRPPSEGGPSVSVLEFHFPPGTKPEETPAPSNENATKQNQEGAPAAKQSPLPGTSPADSVRVRRGAADSSGARPPAAIADSANAPPVAADSLSARPPAAADSVSAAPAIADSVNAPPAGADSANATPPPDNPEGEPPPEVDPE